MVSTTYAIDAQVHDTFQIFSILTRIHSNFEQELCEVIRDEKSFGGLVNLIKAIGQSRVWHSDRTRMISLSGSQVA
jgi:hypothetical protein